MMTTSLIALLRQDSLAARKARETVKATFLVTLMAEAAKVGKDDGNREPTDAEVSAVIKKFIKNTEETLRVVGDNEALRAGPQLELALLKGYLPRQATEAELQTAIDGIVGQLSVKSPKEMGKVMAQLNTAGLGDFDKALASRLVKSALA